MRSDHDGPYAPLLDLAAAYVVVETNAPRRYDYGYCIPITVHAEPDLCEPRHVAIPTMYVRDQIARYHSGLYSASVESGMSLNAQLLVDRITLNKTWEV